jgi:membrane protein YdbS with pleckstrin-like domain
MYNHSSSTLLRWLKVPPEPHAPFGDPASLRVFRAGKNYFKLRLLGWSLGQAAALVGIIFWAIFFLHVEDRARIEKANRATQAQTAAANPAPAIDNPPAETSTAPAKKAVRKKRVRASGWEGFVQGFVQIALVLPAWAFPVIWAIKLLGFLLYLIQIPITYSVLRLDYEMRWYVVTDRSLRIRSGVWSVQELTMSFANLQQVVVTQGPLQRLLKLADVRVQSAGGGGGEGGAHHGSHGDRDLILARLKQFRESGLGDPEESRKANPHATNCTKLTETGSAVANAADVIAAARELTAEARALRNALS